MSTTNIFTDAPQGHRNDARQEQRRLRLVDLIKERCYDRNAIFSKATGINASLVSQYKTGARPLTEKSISVIENKLDVPGWFGAGTSLVPPAVLQPRLTMVSPLISAQDDPRMPMWRTHFIEEVAAAISRYQLPADLQQARDLVMRLLEDHHKQITQAVAAPPVLAASPVAPVRATPTRSVPAQKPVPSAGAKDQHRAKPAAAQ